jgi:hypothetical protein
MTEATTEVQEGQTAPIEGADGVVATETTTETNTVPDPYEELARGSGWSPKEEWRGKPEDWREPRDFIEYGMRRSRESAEELRGLRQSVGSIAKTAEALQRRAVEETRRELEERFAGAVENKDHDAARAVRDEITRLDQPQQTGPVPEVNDFVSRNAAWFNVNRAATALAQSITADLAAKGVTPAEQLRAAEEAVKADFPQLFGTQQTTAKPSPSVSAPTTRTAAPSKPNGFASLPAEAQKAGHDFVKRGMVKTLEDYARVYREENN